MPHPKNAKAAIQAVRIECSALLWSTSASSSENSNAANEALMNQCNDSLYRYARTVLINTPEAKPRVPVMGFNTVATPSVAVRTQPINMPYSNRLSDTAYRFSNDTCVDLSANICTVTAF